MDIYLLDVGNTKYGDCLVVLQGNRSILIDGAHPGDQSRLAGQFKIIFDQAGPFHFDLLVVTHCHSDHIGCLPKLVEDGTVTFKHALVADEKFGWGRDSQDHSDVDAMPSDVQKILLALQEEPVDDASDEEVEKLLEDASTLESKYKAMLASLKDAGVKIIRYGRDAASKVSALEHAFSDFGMKVLGPTQAHLLVCASRIAAANNDAMDALESDDVIETPGGLVAAYRRAVRAEARRAVDSFSDAPLEDRPGVGAAKNDQSIVLVFEEGGTKALLAGDMQFAAHEVPGLEEEMTALREVVSEQGPYDFIKLSHHTSYNGFNMDVWCEWATPTDTYKFAHTGGRNDAGHPDGGVLAMLKEYRDQLEFARTDRNGLISVELTGNGVTMTPSRGSLNNFARNSPPDALTPTVKKEAAETTRIVAVADDRSVIEVVAKVPPNATRVTITVDLDGEKKN